MCECGRVKGYLSRKIASQFFFPIQISMWLTLYYWLTLSAYLGCVSGHEVIKCVWQQKGWGKWKQLCVHVHTVENTVLHQLLSAFCWHWEECGEKVRKVCNRHWWGGHSCALMWWPPTDNYVCLTVSWLSYCGKQGLWNDLHTYSIYITQSFSKEDQTLVKQDLKRRNKVGWRRKSRHVYPV